MQGPNGGESNRTTQELTASERDSLERVRRRTAPVNRRFFLPERRFFWEARRAAPVGDQALAQGQHRLHGLRLAGGEVMLFAQILGEVGLP